MTNVKNHSRFSAYYLGQWIFRIGTILVIVSFFGNYYYKEKNIDRLIDNIHWTVSYLCAAALAWLGCFSVEAAGIYRFRFWFALGLTANALGQLSWAIQVYFNYYMTPTPSDFLFPWVAPCFIIGYSIIVIECDRNKIRVAALDALGLITAVLTFSLALYLPQREGVGIAQLLPLINHPVSFLTAAALGILLIPVLRLQPNKSWLSFIVGMGGSGFCWLLWNALFIVEIPPDGTVLNAGFSISTLILGYGVWTWEPKLNDHPIWGRRFEAALRLLPLFEVVASSVTIVLAGTLSGLPEGVRIVAWTGTTIVVLIASVRQTLLVKEMTDAEQEIRLVNEGLEEIVAKRTEELRTVNQYLISKNEQVIRAIANLKNAQKQLVRSEKMAVLGQLVAGIAHELNTPLGAIVSSNEAIQLVLSNSWEGLLRNYSDFTEDEKVIWEKLFSKGITLREFYDTREERTKRKKIAILLNDFGFSEATRLADILTDLGIHPDYVLENFKYLSQKERLLLIAQNALSLSGLARASFTIEKAAEKASLVIQALKEYAYRDRSETAMSPVDVRKQLETVLTLYYSKYKTQVEIVREMPETSYVQGNAESLTQVWTNLIGNALYSMGYKGKIEISCKRVSTTWEVAIKDSGAGIEESIKDRIFEPFFTTKPSGAGTGLGLDICRRIIEDHNGKIYFETSKEGTTFFVILPASEPVLQKLETQISKNQ
ncbi:sensor histidine kinase [Leptospira interrogans]|uniref:histidine kinase n=2 Tax=Leptospira interrogans TaxID=173 RepID=A0AAQ1SQV0_LEPIR|nr:ATP-binding protein [Leptospira interrogans]AKP26882.1 histidine kinase [Leptospira interrogans serovar Manilae]AKP30658.1 histidine kinase [Leptospira interrogans serovar Manilae]EYU63653.1 histidine kinase [Leptospira interrogans serovar Manilae]QOI49799.1 sensor histidine kinase [Leptospira interrogans serovar Bataviae]SOR63793.1 GHKL domain protein [Leptospira interrogans serovar Manilae]